MKAICSRTYRVGGLEGSIVAIQANMPVTFFVEPSRLPSWSPWSEWLESGARREPRCLWLRRPALKRGPELPLQLQGPGGKRVCCRPAAESDGYRQVVDVAGYRPDEVRVRLSADGQVTVSACHRERSDTGFSHSRMVRRLSLPQHVRADQLSSRWTPAGQLVMEAPAAEPSERCGRCPRDQRKVIVVPVTYDTPAFKEGEEKTAEEGEETEESRTEKTCTDQEEVQGEQAHEGEAEQSDGPDVAVDVEAAAEDKENPEMSSESAENPTEKSQDDVFEPAEAAPVEPAPSVAAADEPAEVVDLEAEAAARQEDVPVAVRSGSPASECGQSSVLASVDVSSFLPEEVEVRVSGRHLVIEAVHEETAGDGGSCQLRLARRLPLPTHVDPDLVTCRLTRAGQLLLEAPVTPAPGA
ncbi:uncharacterized protein LOC122369713 [Amphibalanus amphitrite]|uniref:uncharacterized protein LOC122369713 n=1 Tax=Amphibalanus amphitrite TaxID=1232801 RepID=UPI001C8FDD3E|nr:uncharacterized protein LOC122369713 [Amphibalanus amphitrite]